MGGQLGEDGRHPFGAQERLVHCAANEELRRDLAEAVRVAYVAATRARDLIRVPVVDPVAAAVKQAEALIALRTIKAFLSSFRRPASKATTGLSPKLAAHWEGAQ